VSADISDEQRAKLRKWGRAGGKKGGSAGGKMSLRTMTSWQRKLRAHKAGLEGGAPRKIDHERVRALRAAGKKYREIAAELGISMPSVTRILREKRGREKRN
jgi:transposase